MADPILSVAGIEEVRQHRTWFLCVGILLIVCGTIALGSTFAMTLVSMVFLGWLLVISGVLEVIHGFARRGWGGFFINLLGGILYAVAGLIFVANPGAAAITLTLIIAMILIAAGTFRLFVAFTTPMHHRGWLIFNGAISLVLGFSILGSWPISGLWAIGLFIGIDFIVDGWTEVMLALAAPAAAA
ncbi:MAG TPA: HdeD family acid-resistance protein [Candidatus Acidoferrales bacterium]|nr:HdeD family acid-resistance protein [Candidatus Acidoferrales bacterium]